MHSSSLAKFFDLFEFDGFKVHSTVNFSRNSVETDQVLPNRNYLVYEDCDFTMRKLRLFTQHGPRALAFHIGDVDEQSIDQLETNMIVLMGMMEIKSLRLEFTLLSLFSIERIEAFYINIFSHLPPSLEYLDLRSVVDLANQDIFHLIPTHVHSIMAHLYHDFLSTRTGDVVLTSLDKKATFTCSRLKIEFMDYAKLKSNPNLNTLVIEQGSSKFDFPNLRYLRLHDWKGEFDLILPESLEALQIMGVWEGVFGASQLRYLFMDVPKKQTPDVVKIMFPNLEYYSGTRYGFGKISELGN